MAQSIDFDFFNTMFQVSPDSKSGLVWSCKKKGVSPGDQAGTVYSNGYWCLRLRLQENSKRQIYFVHRIVYVLYHKQNIDGLFIDHVDKNKLNNKISNLRIATLSQNQWNKGGSKSSTSQYKGVSWAKNENKWRACIHVNKKQIALGYFDDELEAANVYKNAANTYHGEFTCC